MANFQLPKKLRNKNNNRIEVPAEYLKNEEVMMFEGEHKGIKYAITANDFARKEITLYSVEDARNPISAEILVKHYGAGTKGAGVPQWSHRYEFNDVAIEL